MSQLVPMRITGVYQSGGEQNGCWEQKGWKWAKEWMNTFWCWSRIKRDFDLWFSKELWSWRNNVLNCVLLPLHTVYIYIAAWRSKLWVLCSFKCSKKGWFLISEVFLVRTCWSSGQQAAHVGLPAGRRRMLVLRPAGGAVRRPQSLFVTTRQSEEV